MTAPIGEVHEQAAFIGEREERAERWRKIKANRVAAGKCPLCAKSAEKCGCRKSETVARSLP